MLKYRKRNESRRRKQKRKFRKISRWMNSIRDDWILDEIWKSLGETFWHLYDTKSLKSTITARKRKSGSKLKLFLVDEKSRKTKTLLPSVEVFEKVDWSWWLRCFDILTTGCHRTPSMPDVMLQVFRIKSFLSFTNEPLVWFNSLSSQYITWKSSPRQKVFLISCLFCRGKFSLPPCFSLYTSDSWENLFLLVVQWHHSEKRMMRCVNRKFSSTWVVFLVIHRSWNREVFSENFHRGSTLERDENSTRKPDSSQG